MKKLYPSFAPPEMWRDSSQSKTLRGSVWKELRQIILKRDKNTCAYCGYRADKYQIVDHIDGNPENNDHTNLQAICQMCNLIKHAGQGCAIKEIVDLYRDSKYSQNDIIRITREIRDKGANDAEIITFLGLKNKVQFLMNRVYLKNLYGFITSRQSRSGADMYDKWLEYRRKNNSNIDRTKERSLYAYTYPKS